MARVRRTVTVTLEERPVALRRGRAAMQQLLGDDASIPLVRDAIMLTTELVTAATNETDCCELNAVYDGESLHVEVADVPANLPVSRDRRSTHDIGLSLVNRMSNRWGARVRRSRAVVWFELDERSYRHRSAAH